jgi:ADP-heptose:LPS heptosyltransferase
MNIIQIDGGIGRVICATPALRSFATNHPNSKLIVISSWPDVFWHNPYVRKCYKLDHPYLWDDVIRYGNFLHPEPYHSHLYYNQKHHLIDSFNFLINGDVPLPSRQPQLFLHNDEIAWAKQLLAHVKKETQRDIIAAYQPYGAGAVVATCDNSNRSLLKATVETIANESRKVGFINCSHIFIDCKNVWNQQFTLRELFAIVSVCDFVVGVDSSLAHIGAAFQKKGVSILGSTYAQNIGYEFYNTFQRPGFPRSYIPNRFHGFLDENAEAMNLDEAMLGEIIRVINGVTL